MEPKVHPYVADLKEQYRQGRITRREFMRLTTLLGLSISGINAFLASCAPSPTASLTQASHGKLAPMGIPAAQATAIPQAGLKRGGELRVIGPVYRLSDPAAGSWTEYNVWWFVTEYLTIQTVDNVTIPWLLEKWAVSDDLKTWTLYCRKGIKFNHGPEFTADNVVFNLKRWLDPATKSSIKGLIGGYLSTNDVEKVDAYTVQLHLSKPQIAVPEHLFHNPAAIVSKDFQGDWVKQPVGTGAYTLAEYAVNERAVLKRRDGYWRNGADGKALPYMDSIRMIYLGSDPTPALAALQSGDADVYPAVSPALLDAVKGNPNISVASHVSSFTYVIKMRADKKPFDDPRVRNAIKACLDRQSILQATQHGYGALAEDHHVAPAHPEYTLGDIPKQDFDRAKALLKDAGYANGLQITVSTQDAEPYPTIAQLFKEQCAPAGINVQIGMMPSNMYWDQWMDVDMGITSWAHRPLAVMTLELAYRTGAGWNETHWSDKEFDTLLDQAEATLDIGERKKIVAKMQKIMQNRGAIAQPVWNSVVVATNKSVKNLVPAAHDHLMAYEAWLDKGT